MKLITVAAQFVIALVASGVLMTALGFSQPPVSRLASLLLLSVGVGGAVWLAGKLQHEASDNIKRLVGRVGTDWDADAAESPYLIRDTLEVKTTWHPVGG